MTPGLKAPCLYVFLTRNSKPTDLVGIWEIFANSDGNQSFQNLVIEYKNLLSLAIIFLSTMTWLVLCGIFFSPYQVCIGFFLIQSDASQLAWVLCGEEEIEGAASTSLSFRWCGGKVMVKLSKARKFLFCEKQGIVKLYIRPFAWSLGLVLFLCLRVPPLL